MKDQLTKELEKYGKVLVNISNDECSIIITGSNLDSWRIMEGVSTIIRNILPEDITYSNAEMKNKSIQLTIKINDTKRN